MTIAVNQLFVARIVYISGINGTSVQLKSGLKVCSPVPTTFIAGAFDTREQLIAGVVDNGDKRKGTKYLREF
jgi:hypothetical protein